MTYESNARFKAVYPYVLSVEGGYVNDPNDKGGATNFGIAFNYNQNALKKFGITQPIQMKNLTKEQAIEIYYQKYWVPSKADELPDTGLAMVYFDHAVNAGQGSADLLLTKLGNRFWHVTGNGANKDFWASQVAQYLLHRLWFYSRLKQWDIYGLGWFNRLIHIAKVLADL